MGTIFDSYGNLSLDKLWNTVYFEAGEAYSKIIGFDQHPLENSKLVHVQITTKKRKCWRDRLIVFMSVSVIYKVTLSILKVYFWNL